MGVRPLAGREFTSADGAGGVLAVIVNRSFAAEHWPGENPVGRRLRLLENGAPEGWLTVVGVAPDIWQSEMIRREFEPLVYLPFRELPRWSMSVAARTRVPPASLAQAFRREVQAIDADLPVYDLRTLDEDLELHDWAIRVFGAMSAMFTFIALLLASVGLYAVVAHSVNQRTQEIGLRMALGAPPTKIMAAVFAEGMRQSVLGLGVGLAAAIGLTRALRAVLVGALEPDPMLFVTVALVLIAAATLACAIPARRATRVDPVEALRFE